MCWELWNTAAAIGSVSNWATPSPERSTADREIVPAQHAPHVAGWVSTAWSGGTALALCHAPDSPLDVPGDELDRLDR